MKRVWRTPAMLVAGLMFAALCAMPQVNTISARPGAINYIEGNTSVNGNRLSAKYTSRAFLNANDTLSTDDGKAEVLLTPGVFLRVGQNSEIRMVSPSLTDTQVAVTKGEAIVEVAELVKENDIRVLDSGASVKLDKIGLYRFTASATPTVEVLEGKAQVDLNDRHFDLSKGRQLLLAAETKPQKFDTKQNQDDLYAWSKVRDEYESASSYAAARNVGLNSYAGGFDGFNGFGGYYGPGWFWNSGWNSWAWLPGDGAFFSPFGFGYYAPGFVGYAPVVYSSLGYGYLPGTLTGRPVAVPVNPSRPPIGGTAANPIVTAGGVFHPGTWSGTVGNRPIGSSGGHVSANSFAARSGASAHAMSGGSAGGGGHFGGAPSGGSFGGGGAHAAGGGSMGGGGGHAGGGGHR